MKIMMNMKRKNMKAAGESMLARECLTVEDVYTRIPILQIKFHNGISSRDTRIMNKMNMKRERGRPLVNKCWRGSV